MGAVFRVHVYYDNSVFANPAVTVARLLIMFSVWAVVFAGAARILIYIIWLRERNGRDNPIN